MNPKGIVLVTGASGELGGILMRRLPASGWRVRGFARSAGEDDWTVGSVTDAHDLDRAMDGVSAIVHLAGVSVPGEPWRGYLESNIDGTYQVLEAARRNAVRRVVLASSNHAVGYTRRSGTVLPGDAAPRPDSLYGVSKIAMEALGSFYADEYGLQTVSVRIGSCFPEPSSARQLETWLSPGDFVRLVDALLRADWAGHRIVWGVSPNTRGWFSLTETEALGYRGVDDAEAFSSSVYGATSDYVGGSAPPTATGGGA